MPEIVYEDNHLLIAVKPPNVLTQSDITGDDCLHEQLKRYIKEKYQKPGAVYIGLVHRLDRPVGGLIAFARTSKAASRLSEQLRARTMKREYLAVVSGGASMPDDLSLQDWLAKDEQTGNVRITQPQANGSQEALLTCHVLARNTQDDTALVHVMLQTGRKHQIRVQLTGCGHPIVYDMRYGKGERGQSIALWGSVLKLSHPTQKTSMTFTSQPKGKAFDAYANQINAFLLKQQEECKSENP
ncbi:MAG: RluA family pseudouridine synthase [Clostridiales bacterium]|nr:RluA family pseudouridine synthase [Clostridiales bacterium]